MTDFNPVVTCIVCGYQPDTAYNGCDINQPYKATAFLTQGHYGSTFFDPMDGSYIEINVCDECLNKAVDKKQILCYNAGNKRAEIFDRNRHEG
jgi:hypothetical protein